MDLFIVQEKGKPTLLRYDYDAFIAFTAAKKSRCGDTVVLDIYKGVTKYVLCTDRTCWTYYKISDTARSGLSVVGPDLFSGALYVTSFRPPTPC